MTLDSVQYEMVIAPSGYVITLRQEIGSDDWIVRVLNFATWKHLKYTYPNEAQARTSYSAWSL